MRLDLQRFVDLEARRAVDRAMWAGDVDELHRIAGCICCCVDHTFTTDCPAYQWGGCRGQDSVSMDDVRGWAKHYGMTVEKFCRPFDVDLPTARQSG